MEFEVEAWALCTACSVAMDLNQSEVIFELDCLELTMSFSNPNAQGPLEISALVEYIKI